MKHKSAVGPEIDRAAEERLRTFVVLLLQWNRRINLLSRGDEAFVWERHILDSVQLVPLLPVTSGRLIDLGSGAGFPGIVLAVLTGCEVHLVESDARKGAFLREATRALGVDAQVHVARAEALDLPPAPVVTARALAPLPELLALAAPLLTPAGICLFPKGRSADNELTAARREWHMQVERFSSRTSPTAALLRLREIRRVTTG